MERVPGLTNRDQSDLSPKTTARDICVLLGYYAAYSGNSVLIAKYYSGNQIEKNEMSGACSTYGGKERCIQDFGGET
jgi:hypothetical protein